MMVRTRMLTKLGRSSSFCTAAGPITRTDSRKLRIKLAMMTATGPTMMGRMKPNMREAMLMTLCICSLTEHGLFTSLDSIWSVIMPYTMAMVHTYPSTALSFPVSLLSPSVSVSALKSKDLHLFYQHILIYRQYTKWV